MWHACVFGIADDYPSMPDEAPISGPVFVAVGEDGLRAFSVDGKEWTHRQTGKEGETLTAACFGGGRCVAAGRFGGLNHFHASSDGVAWNPSEHDAKYSNFVRNVVYFNDQFLAVAGESAGGGKPFVLPSADGVKWGAAKPITLGKDARSNALLRRFAIGQGCLVGVGDYGRKCVTRDAVEWTNAPGVKAADTLIDVAFGNGVFVGGGMHGLRMRSADGLAWTDRVVGEEGEHINSIAWDGQRFVGIGQGATYFSEDGKTWDRKPNTNAPTAAAFGGGVHVGSLYPGRLLRSTDGVAWEETVKLPQHVYAMAHGGIGNGG